MLNVFVGENLNCDYLFEIVLYIKMRIWHYVRFKNRQIVLICMRLGQWFFILRIADFNRCIVSKFLYSVDK